MEKLYDYSLMKLHSMIMTVWSKNTWLSLIDIFSVNHCSVMMKPNRPQVVNFSRNYITISWENCDSVALKEIKRENYCQVEKATDDLQRWYVLEKKDRVLGWSTVYMGFKTQTEVGPLAPSDYYQFRLKVTSRNEESDWSDTLFAVTRDDIVPVAQLHRAVENGPVTTLRKILSQRLSSVNVPNKFGQTPLRLALLKNNLNFMGILLANGADIDSPESGSGKTPLMSAAQRGQLEAVQLLLEKGASWETKDRNGLTALNYAVDNSHLETVQFAVENGADVGVKDKFGWTLLMRGVILKSALEVLKYILNNGGDPNDADSTGQTALMNAVISGRAEIVELLLEKGADIKRKNVYGHSAYDMAKSSPCEEIIKMAHILGEEPEEDSRAKKKKGRGVSGTSQTTNESKSRKTRP